MFVNTTRIKGVKAYSDLNLEKNSKKQGKWFVLDFESFSAGKKTLEKFMQEDWFGINKFWLKGNLAVCLATDGR